MLRSGKEDGYGQPTMDSRREQQSYIQQVDLQDMNKADNVDEIFIRASCLRINRRMAKDDQL